LPHAPDCAVIGAGPAGLAAAAALGAAGARVTLYEHKASPARKFLMAGRGGLNLTHSEPLETFLARYGAAQAGLAPHIRAFNPTALRDFCERLGESTFVGSSGRVFPRSFKASPLARALLAHLAGFGARIETRCAFEGFSATGEARMRRDSGEAFAIRAGAYVLALGGASWPRLGSDGGWVPILRAMGVEVTPLAPANAAARVAWSPRFLAAFDGAPLKNIAASHGDARIRGDLVVTREGLEGGPAYALASALRETALNTRGATLLLDLRPDAAAEALAEKLAVGPGKQSFANFLRKALKLGKLELALLREATPAPLPRAPQELAALIKAVPLRVDGVGDLSRAISSSGGVALSEVDAELQLKKAPGVFIAGEMLDFDAPTGGYLLQAAFSTGFAAGRGAARFLGLPAPAGSEP
jgi:uncharacterized flavoprotein (TIGR03862 family)